MDNEKTEDFTLEVDTELRFEIETKNRKVIVEVRHSFTMFKDDFDFFIFFSFN